MPVSAKLNYLRIAPRKVRLVADMIRGKKLEEARDILRFTVKKSSLPFLKLLDSAESNAKNNLEISPENLYIAKVTVDEGPKLKRWRPRARGVAYPIQKKTSHITIILEPFEGKIKKIKKKKTVSKGKKTVTEKSVEKKKKPSEERIRQREEIKKEPRQRPQKPTKRTFRRKSF